MLLSQGSSVILTLGVGAVLARLLTPADFGLYAMAGAGIGVVHLFKDFGLSDAVVQSKHLDHGLLSTLFWINVGLCTLLMLAGCAVSPLLAWFFEEPKLIPIVCISSLAFLGTGLGLQHLALLRRKMRFGLLFRINLANMVLGGILVLTLAFLDFGVWSLVIAEVANPFLLAGLAAVTGKWLPGLPERGTGARKLLAFGANLTGFSFINWFARSADNLIVGRYLGAVALGYYSKAYNLLLLPLRRVNGPFTGAMIPVLSRLTGEPERYRRFYYHGVQMLLALTWPLTAFLIIFARDAVLLLLGDQWLESVAIFRALGLAALVGCTNFLTGWAYRSLGHVDRQLKAVALQTPLIVAAFFIGLPWGVTGVAWAYSGACLLLRVPYIAWCFRGTLLSFSDLITKGFAWPCATTAISGCLCAAIAWFFPDWPSPLRLLVFALVFGILYVGFWLGLPAPRRALAETWDTIEGLPGFGRILRSPRLAALAGYLKKSHQFP